MSHLNPTVRRRVAVIMALSVAAVGLGLAGPGLRSAVAEEECDEQCWAILYYLSQQGLTSEEIEALGASGLPPDPLPPPVTTTTLQPTTTTAPAVWQPTTTTAPAVWQTTTTTAPPVGGGGCDPTQTWACDEVNAGIGAGYLPDDFNPHDPTQTQDLLQIIEDFGAQHPSFDQDAALLALQDAGHETDRGEMFNAIAAGLGIPYNPEDGGDAAGELGDLGIVWGHDGDPTNNPHGDADPDSTLSNAALAALLDRIEGYTGPGDGGPTVGGTTGGALRRLVRRGRTATPRAAAAIPIRIPAAPRRAPTAPSPDRAIRPLSPAFVRRTRTTRSAPQAWR